MLDIVGQYILIFFSSAVKFVAGPLLGATKDVPILITAALTILGATTSVVICTYVGDSLRRYLHKRGERRKKSQKVFTKKKRKLVNIYNRFGIRGIAFFTPLLLTPIGGTIVALSFGVPRKKILWAMIPSIIFWGFLITIILALFWEEIAPLLGKHPAA